MNVRTVSNPIIPAETVKTNETKDVRMNNSSEDRDADGRRHPQEQSQDPLNEEEMKKAKEYFDKLTSLKTNGLRVEVEAAGDRNVFLIKDPSGVVVRRIRDWEVRPLLTDKSKKIGQIFDKAA